MVYQRDIVEVIFDDDFGGNHHESPDPDDLSKLELGHHWLHLPIDQLQQVKVKQD